MKENPLKLAGKTALVTGGSRGLGVGIALALADEGANVAISYVASADKAAAVVELLKAKGVAAAAFQADQGDPTNPKLSFKPSCDTSVNSTSS